MALVIAAGRPVMLVDTSYYIFHRYFATGRWFGFQAVYDPNTPWMEQPEFLDAFFRHLENDMRRWRKQFGLGPTADIVFCLDCPRSEIFRNGIAEGYKEGRTAPAGFDGEIFSKALAYLEARAGVRMMGHAGCEADDIAAIVHGRIREVAGAEHPILILTNDNDYLQLGDAHTQIFNMAGKDLKARGLKDPWLDLFAKVLLGDKSDGIAPIRARLGPKTAQSMLHRARGAEDPEADLEGQVRAMGKEAWEAYVRNRALIDFRQIPAGLRGAVCQKMECRMG